MEEKNKGNDVLLIKDESEPILIERIIAPSDTADRLYQTQKAVSALQRKTKEE